MNARLINPMQLERSALFRNLTSRQIELLAALGSTSTLHSGLVLYQPHGRMDTLVVVSRGSIGIHHPLGNQSLLIGMLGAGDTWGHEALVTPSATYPYRLSVSGEATDVISFNITQLLKRLRHEPDVLAALHHAIAVHQSEQLSRHQSYVSLLTSLVEMTHGQRHGVHSLDDALKMIAQSLHAHRAAVLRFDEATDMVLPEAVYNFRLSVGQPLLPVAGDTLATLLHTTRRPIIITPHTFDRQYHHVPYAHHTMLMIPLLLHNRLYGALVLAGKEDGGQFTPTDAAMLQTAGPLLASSLNHRHESNLARAQNNLKRAYI